MQWIGIVLIGVLCGLFVSGFTDQARRSQLLRVSIAVLGAILGAVLTHITGFTALGAATIYVMAAVLAILTMGGGLLAFTLITKD